LNELTELAITLFTSLHVIIKLTYTHDISRVGITAVGGVEAVVEVMKTFPKCQALQESASLVLGRLASCDSGTNKAVETGGIEVLLAAVNNHLDSVRVCHRVCWVLSNIVTGRSKENTGLLISRGGATALAKVRTKWPDNECVQIRVRELGNCIAAEMKTWGGEE
jgi:hypothetical protein